MASAPVGQNPNSAVQFSFAHARQGFNYLDETSLWAAWLGPSPPGGLVVRSGAWAGAVAQVRLEDGLRERKPARGPPLPAVRWVHDAIRGHG